LIFLFGIKLEHYCKVTFDGFPRSIFYSAGKSPSSKELLTTQKLSKYQTSKRKSLLGSITGNKDLEMETADAMASEEQIKTVGIFVGDINCSI